MTHKGENYSVKLPKYYFCNGTVKTINPVFCNESKGYRVNQNLQNFWYTTFLNRLESKINRRELRLMKTNGKLNSTALALAALILFISLLSSTAIALPLPNSAEIVNVKFIASPTTGYAPLTVHFYDQTTFGTGGMINNRYWNFGDGANLIWDGNGPSSLTKNPTHTYRAPGEYKVTFIEGATFPTKNSEEGYYNDSISTKVIKVLKTPVAKKPVAAFSAFHLSGSTVGFMDKSSESPTSWYWKFGDGGTSHVENPAHKYSMAGKKYLVSLTVKNKVGSNTVNKYVTP